MESELDGSQNVLQVIAVLLATGFGTGVFVMPFAMQEVGYAVFALVLVLSAAYSGGTTAILFLATRKKRLAALAAGSLETGLLSGRADAELTYNALLVDATHPCFAAVLDALIAVYCLGCVLSYFIFIPDFLQRIPFWPIEDPVATLVIVAAVTVSVSSGSLN